MTSTLDAFDRLSDGCIALDRTWHYTYVNDSAAAILGRDVDELLGKHIWTEFPTPADDPFRVGYETAMSQQRPVIVESLDMTGIRWYQNRIYPSDDGVTVIFIDVTERKSAEVRELTQNRILEGIAAHHPLEQSLSEIALLHERLNPDALCSVLLVSPDGKHLVHGAAPSLSHEFTAAVDGGAIGEGQGSCGTAAARGDRVIVANISTDPLWEQFRGLAVSHGLQACWSAPVVGVTGEVLGTFAVYYRQRREPTEAELRSIDAMLSITAVAIESDRLITRLRERDHFFELSNEIYCIFDTTSKRIVQTNTMFRAVTGYSLDDLVDHNYFDFLHPDDRPHADELVHRANVETRAGEPRRTTSEFRYLCKDGRYRWLMWETILGPDGLAFGVARDVTHRREADAALEHASRHDGLTGLPRRSFVEASIQSLMEQRPDDDAQVWVLVLGLDRFHSINETMGHDIGDDVLRQTAERLSQVASDADVVGRFASDKFVVVAPADDRTQATELADRMRAAVCRPIETDDYRLVLTASVGISRGPDHGPAAQDLLQRAEAAMTNAKSLGGNTSFHFSTDQMRDIEERLQLGRRLRQAVANGDLELHYQPQHRASDSALTGLEALLRWTDDEWGRVPPDRFIPIAETMGLMPEVGEWVLNEACRQARVWLDAGHTPIPIAVNISAQELQRGGLPARVREALDRHSVPAASIAIELTESSLMENVERATATLFELTEIGTDIALDDFGTGYSSLAYIKHFPISKIKIDKSFVSALPDDDDDAAIVRTVIAMAHQLRMAVAAEGVETDEQLEFLRADGCDELQGYLLGRPVPADEIERLFGAE